MTSVTNRIKEIKQPRGGYIKPSLFNERLIDDKQLLNEKENISPIIVGLAVDYLTRFAMGSSVGKAFEVSLIGAENAEQMNPEHEPLRKANKLLSNITGIDETSIVSACKLATFDVWYRNFDAASNAKKADETNPDGETIENIKIMIERGIKFWKDYGPIVKDGFSFDSDAFTETVNSGDGDYLTSDGLWDMKVSKSKLTNKHTLQLLMYWIMGKHSGQKIFKNINKLGIFNPRLNTVYTIDVKEISEEIIDEIEKNVICY